MDSQNSGVDTLIRFAKNNGLILGFVFLAGCATIVSGKHQDVVVTSSPEAADVTVTRSVAGQNQIAYTGMTPATIPLVRTDEYVLSVSLDGYEPASVILENGLNGWIWGNLLFGGPIGAIVDFASGSAKKIDPGEVHVDLITVNSASLDSKPELYAVFKIKNSEGDVAVSPVKMILDS